MSFLKKMWQRIAAGKSPGRVFRYNRKIYIVNKVFGSLAVSRSTGKDFLKGLLTLAHNGIFIFGNLMIAAFVGLLFFEGGTSFASCLALFGPLWILFNVSLPLLLSAIEGVSLLSVFRSEPPLSVNKYAGKKSADLLRLVPHLSNEEVAMMIDHVIELKEIDKLIAKAEKHLRQEDSSVLDSEVRKQLSHLRKRSEEISSFRFNNEVQSVYDEETLNILEEMSKATQSSANLVNSSVRGDKTTGKDDEGVLPVEIEVLSGKTAHAAIK